MSSETQRADWRALANAATPGEWTVEIEEYGKSGTVTIPEIERILHDSQWADPDDFHRDADNAKFIAAARTAVPALLDDVEQLEEMVRELLEDKAQLRRQLAEEKEHRGLQLERLEAEVRGKVVDK